MKKRFITIGIICFGFAFGYSQNRAFYGKKHEIGVNVTGLISNVLSLNQNQNELTPYVVAYRLHQKKFSIRFDLNSVYQSNNIFDINGTFREGSTSNTQLRAGYEKIIVLNKKFAFGYGLDLLGSYGNSDSFVSGFFIDRTIVSFGGGPAIRMNFKLSERIVLSTESTLYGRIMRETTNDNLGAASPPDITNYKVELKEPLSLYITILL